MNFETIKKYFTLGMWSERMVANAVKKGIITAQQFHEITGKTFE